ncbi:DUF805 domain-containing protein [Litoreibacter halocynthiae]|uniref:DUF805 domain-containing protein n=1 Tax=Litoreibacter halocynthiae TaxID=1242689 RepID=UPI0024905C52|nr:DUF805 domain-containing protein [Litoreibacter halocynthiae]
MTLANTIKRCLTENYWSFDGRASRSEFWGFMLFLFGVQILLILFTGTWQMKPLSGFLFETPYGFYLLRTVGTAIELVLVIPAISVTVRRFHDSGLSGWWYLGIVLTTVAVGLLVENGKILSPLLFVSSLSLFTVRKGTDGKTKFGPAPNYPSQGLNESSHYSIGPKKLWIGLRPRTAVIAVATISVLGILDVAIANAQRPEPDPFFNPDRQQVTLRDPGPDERWRTADDAMWALSFPMTANVAPVLKHRRVSTITAESLAYVRKHGFGTTTVEIRPPLPVYERSTLKILLSLPGFGNVTGSFEDQRQTTIEISLPSERRSYSDTQDWGKVPSFVGKFEKLTEFDCEADSEISPGIFRLRNMSDENAMAADKAFGDRGPRFETRRGCVNKNALRGASYAVLDENSTPVGIGKCELYSKTAEFANCHFEFWLPQERIVEYRFSEEFLPMLREIDDFARNLLAEATVVHASENIALSDRPD